MTVGASILIGSLGLVCGAYLTRLMSELKGAKRVAVMTVVLGVGAVGVFSVVSGLSWWTWAFIGFAFGVIAMTLARAAGVGVRDPLGGGRQKS